MCLNSLILEGVRVVVIMWVLFCVGLVQLGDVFGEGRSGLTREIYDLDTHDIRPRV